MKKQKKSEFVLLELRIEEPYFVELPKKQQSREPERGCVIIDVYEKT
jgi:hypothetical protein